MSDPVAIAYQWRGIKDMAQRVLKIKESCPNLSDEELEDAFEKADKLVAAVLEKGSVYEFGFKEGYKEAERFLKEAVPGLSDEAYESAATTIHYNSFR